MHTPDRARRPGNALRWALVLSAFAATGAPAQVSDIQAALNASSCNACHGPAGHSIAGIPPLTGRSAQELAAALLDFKYDRRASTVMHRHAKGYSDDELRRIADEFARQSQAPEGRR